LAALALVILLLDREAWRRQPKTLHSFFLAIWACYGLSWLIFLRTGNFYLYLPSRYTEAGLIIVLLIFVVVNGRNSFHLFVNLLMSKPKIAAWGLLGTAVAVLVLAGFLPAYTNAGDNALLERLRWILWLLGGLLFVLALIYMRRKPVARSSASPQMSQPHWLKQGIGLLFLLILSVGFVASFQPQFYEATAAERRLFTYLQRLSKDTVLSGAPYVLDSVPTFGQRSVFMNCENPTFAPGEIIDSLHAYYAPVGEEQRVESFCQQYEVDYLVIDSRNYAPETRDSSYCSFAPYDRALYQDMQSTSRFALDTIPEEQRLFQSGTLFVVPCDAAIFSK
jgi:hypothetical protein